jgi:hypothetical protein
LPRCNGRQKQPGDSGASLRLAPTVA